MSYGMGYGYGLLQRPVVGAVAGDAILLSPSGGNILLSGVGGGVVLRSPQ